MLSMSHKKIELDVLIDAFDKTCKKIREIKEKRHPIKKYLNCKPMQHVFKGLRERNAVSN